MAYKYRSLDDLFIIVPSLKLPSLFAAWLFSTFHNKSHSMKALVILSHSSSPFLPLTCLYGKIFNFYGSLRGILEYFRKKKLPRFPMQITWPWPPVDRLSHGLIAVHKTKENVNIKLLDLCESFIVYVLLSTCQWVDMVLAINIPDILLMQDSDEKLLQNYSCLI